MSHTCMALIGKMYEYVGKFHGKNYVRFAYNGVLYVWEIQNLATAHPEAGGYHTHACLG